MKIVALAVAAVAFPLVALGAPETYTFDPYHTFPHFEVEHLGGFSKMRGRFDKTSGKFTIDRDAKVASLDLIVQTVSVTTGDGDKGSRPRARDEHLRTPDFFNVAEFPTMTLKANAVKFSGEFPSAIDGQLTLLGVTKPIALTVENWKCGPHPVSKKAMCGGNASGHVKRTDFGMKFGVPNVGDELKLWIEFEAYKD